MALPKRAKKFRQKHLGDKIEQKKREKKHAQLVKSRKSKSGGGPAPAAKPAPDFNVQETELFDDGPGDLDKYLSDSDQSEIEAEEAEYFNNDESDLTKGAKVPSVITAATVSKWKKELGKSPQVLRAIVTAAGPEKVDAIANEAVLDALRDLLLVDVPRAVSKHFPLGSAAVKGQKSVFKALADLLGQLLLDVSSQDQEALIRVVAAVKDLIPYFVSFRQELKSLTKGLVAVIVRSDRDDRVKLVAFDALRLNAAEVGLQPSGETLATIAKQAYTSLVKVAAHTNSYTLDSINLAKNLFALLFEASADHPELYQLAFQQIRQLALHLKTALDKTKHPDFDTKVVYTWQFVQSLDFWSRAIALSPGLHPLIHPLCQVTLRVINLVPSQQYLPLRFYLVRSLIRVGQHTGVFIPLAPPLIEAVLHTSVLSKAGKPATLQQPDFEAVLHVPQGYVGTLVYQNSVLEEFVDVFVDALVLYTKSIAFPELIAPVTVVMRKFAKHSSPASNTKVRKTLVALCDRLEANAQYILKHRANVTFGPQNKAKADQFLSEVDWQATPLGKEAVARRKVREQRRELVAKAKQEDETNKELDEFAGSSSSEDEEEHENEDEEENEEEIEAALEELEAD